MLNVIPPTWRAECMHSYVIPASRGAQMYASRGSFIVGVFREAGEQQICTWEGHVKIFLCLCDLLEYLGGTCQIPGIKVSSLFV